MIKAMIIDDEPAGIGLIQHLLKKACPGVEVVGTASTFNAALEVLKETSPQLIFLDINMPGKNGFDILRNVNRSDYEVIFVTGYMDYTKEAFKYDAVDYLMKPINAEELSDAVSRAEERIFKKHKKKANVEGLMSNLVNLHNPFSKICIPCRESHLFVDLSNIVYIESQINYSEIHMKDGSTIVAAKSLKLFEELLGDMNFSRIHKSYLINLFHLKEYVRGEGGTVILINGKQLPVSRRQKESFVRRLAIWV